ncbi:MAG: TAXI family TRAP transporter solute-binding subunit [Lachnospiraceae bacterium]|nr:TAXI family TRAP transporter solute-binding subunit [Lachnospiraceae bacterium]
MKKLVATTLAAVMVAGAFAGCGSKAAAPATPAAPAADAKTEAPAADAAATTTTEKPAGDPVDLLFSTFQVGTSNYTISAGLGTMWLDYLPEGSTVDVQPTSPGGMGAPYLFANGQADIAFVNGAPAKWAYEEGTLGKEPTQEYRALVGSMTAVSAVSFFTQSFIDKYGYTTIEDVVANKVPIRIGCSPKGSMDEKVVEMLLDHLGVTYDDIKSWGGDIVHGGGSDLSAMVKDGKIDMMLDHTSIQSSTMTEIAMTCDVQFLQLKDETLDWFCTQGFERITVPAGSWEGQEKEIINAGTPDCIFVAKTMPDDVAYYLAKGICEQRDYLVSQYASIEPFDPETCWMPEKVGNVPLHPGAERYFKEMGYIK